ncbi:MULTISPECIES: DUF2970 domain-containing protein [Idiomarinaceae]|uniref:DUF2970 domain-containing protein n=1 Tax=Pseudidiomarina sp. PP-1MA TaxID=3237706 RepID=A0AB39X8W9_9GAMM|nr:MULTISPECIES: DUF2970 domain-containing protein [Idiomarina]MRJ42882.1 DUF2970 domain-containing protein [Idiomarina sp. FeN1]NCU58433.1 DUF2970 domain-containing protein [Idiomarina sp. FenA--70]NCU61130.1 DUF2970 domain-containing protein [Idiomarina sp. FenBw--71]UUN13632.1 DUF2970 domain-containing protein [Idiomarina loihiensis]
MLPSVDNTHVEKPGLLAVIVSVLAAMFGVQTEANRKRDFNKGNPLLFIGIGVVFAVLFVLGLVLLVNTILAS